MINKLDFNLQKYADRAALVDFYCRCGNISRDTCPPSELDKIANYLLYAEDVRRPEDPSELVELKTSATHKTMSLDALTETGGMGLAVLEDRATHDTLSSIYRYPKPSIHRDDPRDASVSNMPELWDAIDNINEKYEYCRQVLAGQRDMDENRLLTPTYKNKYFYHKWMVELRREQFLLRDFTYPVAGSAPHFTGFARPKDELGMCIGKHIVCDGAMGCVDFANPKHLYALAKYYGNMRSAIACDRSPWDNQWAAIYELYDELSTRARLSPAHRYILMRKIDKIPNEQIAQELEDKFGRTYSVNYISTIFKQSIPKEISKYAYLWWNEKEYAFDGTMAKAIHWKVCPTCGRTMLADELNFGRLPNGEWHDLCVDCEYKRGDK